MTDRSFELYGPTNTADFRQMAGLVGTTHAAVRSACPGPPATDYHPRASTVGYKFC